MPRKEVSGKVEGGLWLKGSYKTDSDILPLVSIITVVRNGKQHVKQAIDSVLGQTYPNIEYIVIDGGSSDGTLELIEEYGERLDFYSSERDGGIYDAMNRGIAKARGKLVGLKNADDWYLPDAIEKAVTTYNKTKAEVIYGDTLMVWQEAPLQTSLFTSDHRMIGVSGGIDHRTMFVARDLYKTLLYDTRFKISADYDWLLRARQAGAQFAHARAVISYKRAGGASGGWRVISEVFAINSKHNGLETALTVWAKSIYGKVVFSVGNGILKAVLGQNRFAAFKARKRLAGAAKA
jgi:glycosyltransferase involved in cell wall biosynthesis